METSTLRRNSSWFFLHPLYPHHWEEVEITLRFICPYISLSWAWCWVQFRCPPSPPHLPAHTCHSFPSLCSRRLLLLPQLVLMLLKEGYISWFRITSVSPFKILPPIMPISHPKTVLYLKNSIVLNPIKNQLGGRGK